ncbi:hypothetical protein C6V83_12610 [Gordonia iterans]|uniref:Impact N-terminal domain-containing protein n=1 Tax=Gordonia iterans TaxID=1004901 RepID=A0A2S0KH14_9ACTN|nr:hypothetical protein C6V83_12610 [Gordonia iterans]NLG48386.1 YigZ family protein [Gordonia sp. (in: high G+C Gram-positive bacteria)]
MLVLDGADEVVESTTIRKSRFVATVAPVSSEDELSALVDRKRDPSANHTCWGAVIGSGPQRIARCSDDGEPAGTAGPPILAALTSREVVDAAIVVVRWFGGVKLGAGGLVRAYGGSATAVLDKASLREARPVTRMRLDVPVHDAGRAERLLYSLGDVHGAVYGAACVTYTVEVGAEHEGSLRDRLMSLTSGGAQVVEVARRLA